VLVYTWNPAFWNRWINLEDSRMDTQAKIDCRRQMFERIGFTVDTANL
jgi:hypothetical protein